MKQKLQGLLAGVLIGTMITGGAAFARSRVETIEVTYDDIKVYKDNVLCELKDVNGKTIEPFIYNGTTYVPVRGAANLADMEVSWDGANKSIYLWDEQVADGTYLLDVCPPYEGNYNYYLQSDGEFFKMAGKKYTNGITLCWDDYVLFNLDSKYSEIEFTIGHVDDTDMNDGTVYFYIDGKLVEEIEVGAEDLPKTVSLDVKYGLQMKILADADWDCIGLGNITVR